MANIDHILQTAEQQMVQLAKTLLVRYRDGAVADGKDFLQQTKSDLTLWVNALELRKLDKDEFESLVQGKKDLAEMRALKQTGLAQIAIDQFVNGVLNIVIDAAFSAVGI